MTKRLQVLLEDDELAAIQESARQRNQTTAAWVREALRVAREAGYPEAGRKLKAIREAAALSYPTGDIEVMLAEIERGYADGGPE